MCRPLQPLVFCSSRWVIKAQPRWLAWSSEYNQNQRETCWVPRIREHCSQKGFQEVIWSTCLASGEQWNSPKLIIIWGQRLHKASNLLVQVCTSLQFFLNSKQTHSCCYSFYLPNQCLMERTVFNGENSVSLLWGLICSTELMPGKSWKTILEMMLCGEL